MQSGNVRQLGRELLCRKGTAAGLKNAKGTGLLQWLEAARVREGSPGQLDARNPVLPGKPNQTLRGNKGGGDVVDDGADAAPACSERGLKPVGIRP